MTEKIYEVTDVSASIGKSNPPVLIVNAAGIVPTGGWSNGQLSPHIYIKPPEDGIQDFDFIADKPAGIVTQVLMPITAETYTGPVEDWVKGVRVHARMNSKEVSVP